MVLNSCAFGQKSYIFSAVEDTHLLEKGLPTLGKRRERLQLNTNIYDTPVPGGPGAGSGIWALLTAEPRIRICSTLHVYMQRKLNPQLKKAAIY